MSPSDMIDPESTSCGGGGDSCVGLSTFKEVDEVQHLMQQLHVPDQSSRVMEKNLDRFCFIMKQYQDQPQLLDPYLDSLLGPLIEFIKDKSELDLHKHYVFKFIYIIMSVKTYKKIAIHLPHEVIDFNPVLEMLEKQNLEDKDNWQTRYVLLIWLSIISKIPFALSRLETGDSETSISERVICICKKYSVSKDSCSTAAIFLLANFLTRSDVKDKYMEHLIDWALEGFDKDCLNHRPLAVIASIIKHSNREDIAPYTQKIFDKISENKLDESNADLVRKFSIKIIQRIGTTLLKANIVPWQYKKASKTIILSTNLPEISGPVIEPVPIESDNNFVSYYDDHEIPPLIEEIIEHLIRGLQDKSIIIRWSAAKGIGRITARLPSDLADEVLGYVIDLFSSRESETAWHGGCLAIAELGRRGLLLPDRLKDIIPLVVQALVFDEPTAYGPVGSIIRDAACFVCWSFARAFEPEVFQPYVNDVARALLIVTCFDREINCRRAGSAAFQENVGRQGNFPYGIEIISAADYFEVGVRSNAYLKISVHVAKYEGYLKPLIDHLVKRKVTHWDVAIRELSAKALHNLTELDPSYMISNVLPILLDYGDSLDLIVRHGAILAIAEIIVALHKSLEKDVTEIIIDRDQLKKIEFIVSTCRIRGQLRGLGGEIIKQACVTLIKKLATVHFHVDSPNVINDWQGLLEECLSNEVTVVREVSAEAHAAFYTQYYFTWSLEDRHEIINRYLENLRSTSQTVRIGFAEAIGYLPECVLKEKGEDIFKRLMQCCCSTKETNLWAESRRDAMRSLTKLCETLGLEHTEIWKPFVIEIYDCLFNGLREYTSDSRGDIGSWVREAAIDGILVLTRLVFKAGYTDVLTQELMTKIVSGISQQAVERIDRTRSKAGNAFHMLIQSNLPNIPHREELKALFTCTDDKKFIDWRSESETFPLFIQMLSFPPYVQDLLRGIIFSAGGLSESLVKHSSMSLFSYLQQLDKQTQSRLCDEICNIFESCHGDDRMIAASLAFLDRLFSSGCIQSVLDDPESEIPKRILTLLKKESKCINATQSQLNSVKLFCHLLQVRGPVSKGAFSQLGIYLCHKFKFVRKATASRLYESLTLHGDEMDVSEEELSVLLTQLNTVDWEEPVENLRPIRNKLCEIMKCSIPTIVQKPKNN